jgi:flagellar biosynthesis protein FlhF
LSHFLVLSATAKDEDLKQTIVHFGEININSLIFTKLDETFHHGCILNQLLRFNHPISFMGTGQRVPEDIEPATQKRLLSLLLPAGNKSA